MVGQEDEDVAHALEAWCDKAHGELFSSIKAASGSSLPGGVCTGLRKDAARPPLPAGAPSASSANLREVFEMPAAAALTWPEGQGPGAAAFAAAYAAEEGAQSVGLEEGSQAVALAASRSSPTVAGGIPCIPGAVGTSGSASARTLSSRLRASSGGRSPMMRCPRSIASASGTAAATARSHEGGVVISAVKKELDSIEGRLADQVARGREVALGAQQKSDAMHEAAFQHLEAKTAVIEAAQAKLDRKLSEASGALRALHDETQSTTRRADAADARFFEWRHRIEEGLRQKHTELDHRFQDTASNCRIAVAAAEELQKQFGQRLKRLEELVEDRLTKFEEAGQAIFNLEARFDVLEAVRQAADDVRGGVEVSAGSSIVHCGGAADDARIWQLERRVDDLKQSIDRATMEAHSDQGWEARLEEHEVRITAIRSKLDNQEGHYSNFDDRVRLDWESKFEQFRRMTQETAGRHLEDHERLEWLGRRVEGLGQIFDELQGLAQQRCAATGLGPAFGELQLTYDLGDAALEGETPLEEGAVAGERSLAPQGAGRIAAFDSNFGSEWNDVCHLPSVVPEGGQVQDADAIESYESEHLGPSPCTGAKDYSLRLDEENIAPAGKGELEHAIALLDDTVKTDTNCLLASEKALVAAIGAATVRAMSPPRSGGA